MASEARRQLMGREEYCDRSGKCGYTLGCACPCVDARADRADEADLSEGDQYIVYDGAADSNRTPKSNASDLPDLQEITRDIARGKE